MYPRSTRNRPLIVLSCVVAGYLQFWAQMCLAESPAERRSLVREPLIDVTVQLNWQHQFEFAAFYAAMEKGFFTEQGLRVTLLEGGPGIDVTEKVVFGSAQFGVGNSALLVDYALGSPVVVVATLMQSSAFALVSRAKSNIFTGADLQGKRVSCAAHACNEIRAYLLSSGLDDADFELLPMLSSDIDEELETRDAVDIFFSNQGFQVAKARAQYNILYPREAGIDFYGDVFFVSRNYADAHPDVVESMRRAVIAGLRYAFEHPAELIQVIKRDYDSQQKDPEHLAFEAATLQQLNRANLVDYGYVSENRWRHVRDVYAYLGMVDADLPLEAFLYSEPRSEVPQWLRAAFVLITVLLGIAVLVTVFTHRANHRLVAEVARRKSAEAAYRDEHSRFKEFVDSAHKLIAHELRTPMSVLEVHLNLIEKKSVELPTVARNIKTMQLALTRLKKLFERNLQEVFASMSPMDNNTELDFVSTIGKLVTDLLLMHPGLRVEISLPCHSVMVRMTEDVLAVIVSNLLGNAVKFSDGTSPISVKVLTAPGSVSFLVVNKTLLPVPQSIKELTAARVRGSAKDAEPGTGMGLYLVQMIADAHGAELLLDHDSTGQFSAIYKVSVSNAGT